MGYKNVTEIVFSPTGGTKKVENILADTFGETTERINLTEYGIDFTNSKIEKDSLVVIAAPVFEGVIPDIAIERLKQIQGNGAMCVCVAVYGNRAYDDGLIELTDVAKLQGFKPVASIGAVAEHSIMRKFGAGRPDDEDRKELIAFAQKITEKLARDDFSTEYFVPGSHEYKRLGNLNVVPKGNNKCINCGKCAKVCPVGAIDPSNIKTADKTKCISCMGCIAACPVNARKLPAPLIAAAELAMKSKLSKRKTNDLFL